MSNNDITWGDLERGMRIAGGWKVADLTATHITVADEETGDLSTFRRKDPWESISIVPMPERDIITAFGGHPISEDGADGTVYFTWPDDPDFINAAQSHLIREHGVDPDDRTYADLLQLHQELHEGKDAGHQHYTFEERNDNG